MLRMRNSWSPLLLALFALPALPAHGQQAEVALSTVILDGAPRKLYSELYLDRLGHQYLVELYEEPQGEETLVHFRAFRNGKLHARKSESLADSHDFTFIVEEKKDRLIPPEAETLMLQMLQELFKEADDKQKQTITELFKQADQQQRETFMEMVQQEELARNIARNIEAPAAEVDAELLAAVVSENLVPPKLDEDGLASTLSGMIELPSVEMDEAQVAEMISKSLKPPEVDDDALAEKLSGKIQVAAPQVDEDALAEKLSGKIQVAAPQVDDEALAERLSGKIQVAAPQVDDEALAERLSGKIQVAAPQVDDEALAERLSQKMSRPSVDVEQLASQLSGKIAPRVDEEALAANLSKRIRPSPVNLNVDNLAENIAQKLIQKQQAQAGRVTSYDELIEGVRKANQDKDYARAISLLNANLEERTPLEQQRVLKIAGLMSVLVASQKLKNSISTIQNYDLPQDEGLETISSSLEQWINQNLITE
jgi:hypothetical protein